MPKMSSKLLLDLTSGTGVGYDAQCNERESRYLILGIRLECTAAFTGALDTLVGADPVLTDATILPTIATAPTTVGTLPAGVAFTGSQLVFTAVAAGTYDITLRISDPPPIVVPKLASQSGGGTWRLRVKAVY